MALEEVRQPRVVRVGNCGDEVLERDIPPAAGLLGPAASAGASPMWRYSSMTAHEGGAGCRFSACRAASAGTSTELEARGARRGNACGRSLSDVFPPSTRTGIRTGSLTPLAGTVH